jgi:1,4-dihydroxy-2-naphthoate polyprenyltransferase
VMGTAYVQMDSLDGSRLWVALIASLPAGLLACALLMVNNLRDIRSDTVAGKRTLAVRLGDARSRVAYQGAMIAPFVIAAGLVAFRPFVILILPAGLLLRAPYQSVRAGATGPALIRTLGQTGRVQLVYGIGFAIGLAIPPHW